MLAPKLPGQQGVEHHRCSGCCNRYREASHLGQTELFRRHAHALPIGSGGCSAIRLVREDRSLAPSAEPILSGGRCSTLSVTSKPRTASVRPAIASAII